MPRVGKNVNDGMLPSTLFVLTVRYRRLFVSDAATTPLGAKSQHSFVDSRRRDDTYGFRSLACIQSQSRMTGDLEYLHGNNRRSC